MATRLGFYGHSICTENHASLGSYQHMLVNRFPTLEIVNVGSGNCSEERIFYELKKTKDLDIAVIFHSRPSIFIPNSNRDIHTTHRELKDTVDYQWNHLIISNQLRKVFPDSQTMFNTLDLYLSYLSNPDLEKNRFESALLAIDNYCLSGKVKHVIHVPSRRYIPPWFSFSSGVVDQELTTLSRYQGHWHNPNGLQDGINECIADRLGILIAPYINNA